MELKTFINSYRTEHNLTMEQFAKSASLSKGYISMLEKAIIPKQGKNYTLYQRFEQYCHSNRNRPGPFTKNHR